MTELLSNPKALIALACIGALVVGFNLTLFGLLRGSRTVQEEASKWGKALTGGQTAQKRQEAQLDELHQAVANLQSSANNQEHRDKSSTQ